MTAVLPTLTPAEAAERLTAAGVPVSDDTLRRWAKSGRVPCIRLPFGRIRFRTEDIDALTEPTAGAA